MVAATSVKGGKSSESVRALGPFPVREHVVPLLSEALTDDPTTYETRQTATPTEVTDHPSLLT